MKVLALKTGAFSIHPAWGPIVELVEGNVIDLPEDQAEVLYKADWISGDSVEIDEEEVDGIEVDDIESDDVEGTGEDTELDEEELMLASLLEVSKASEDDSENKSAVQDWGLVHLDIKVSKQKSLDNMVSELTNIIKDSE